MRKMERIFEIWLDGCRYVFSSFEEAEEWLLEQEKKEKRQPVWLDDEGEEI